MQTLTSSLATTEELMKAAQAQQANTASTSAPGRDSAAFKAFLAAP
jgi:hypothetical protein